VGHASVLASGFALNEPWYLVRDDGCEMMAYLDSILKVKLLALILAFSSVAAKANEGAQWTIRDDGFGVFDSRPTYAHALSIYPHAKVVVGKSYPGNIWEDVTDPAAPAFDYYVSFSQDGRELFRSLCNCTPSTDGIPLPIFDIPLKNGGIGLPFMPVITGKEFKTESGIGVGSTIAELKKSSHQKGMLFARKVLKQEYPDVSSESVCFVPEKYGSERDNVRLGIVFQVRPAQGKALVGTYALDKFVTSVVDPNGIIMAIAPWSPCDLAEYQSQ